MKMNDLKSHFFENSSICEIRSKNILYVGCGMSGALSLSTC